MSEAKLNDPSGYQPIFVNVDGYRVETWTEENKEKNARDQLEGWRHLGCPECHSITKISDNKVI